VFQRVKACRSTPVPRTLLHVLLVSRRTACSAVAACYMIGRRLVLYGGIMEPAVVSWEMFWLHRGHAMVVTVG